MATVTSEATASSTSSSGSLATTGVVDAAVGDVLIVMVAADNNGTNGASSVGSCSDNAGGSTNVYTEDADILQDPGAAAAGANLVVFTCKVTTALSGNIITVSFSPNTTAKVMDVVRIAPAAGEVLEITTINSSGNVSSTTNHAAGNFTCIAGDIAFGMAAIETNTAVTGDSDTDQGNWSALTSRVANSGSDLTSMGLHYQYKTVGADSIQNWIVTTGAAKDSARTRGRIGVIPLRGGYLNDSYLLASRLVEQGLVR